MGDTWTDRALGCFSDFGVTTSIVPVQTKFVVLSATL